MLEIRRGIAVRHYENSFFRLFAKNLQNMFDKYNLDGLLIANSECEINSRLQIDTLLITQHAVCIIDFKNFSGDIILPNEDNFYDGIWLDQNKQRVKGGSAINPYKQVSIQKKKFRKVFEEHIESLIDKKDYFNPRHILRMVCFQNEVTIKGVIPARDQIDFFIIDSTNYLEQIKDIIDISDKEINLTKHSYNGFNQVFVADKFDLAEQYITLEEPVDPQVHEVVPSKNLQKNYSQPSGLYDSQKLALNNIDDFLQSEDKQILVLNGSVNSGKSFLIPFIEEYAFKHKIQEVKKLVQSKRVANNLSKIDSKFESIYTYIYGGKHSIVNDDNKKNQIELIPLKENDDEEECLYIVDEAHLITDSFYKSIDIQFGSGHLLKDFIEFVKVKDTKRKIIFIGDPYHTYVSLKKLDEQYLEWAIEANYLEKQYGYNTQEVRLLNKEDFSNITYEALKCTYGVQQQKFNFLEFNFSDKLHSIDKNSISKYVESHLYSDSKIIVYTNKDAQKINLWIKKTILMNGNDIAPNDLVLFNNNINLENNNNPFSQPQQISNGQFATVKEVSSNIIHESITLKSSLHITLTFREIIVELSDTKNIVKIISFENFRLNEKNELSDDEIVAYKILLNNIEKESFYNSINFSEILVLASELKEKDFLNKLAKDGRTASQGKNQETIKTLLREARKKYKLVIDRDTSSKYYKYKNTAWLKFGWALTAHKAMSYKWNTVLINTDLGDNRGRTNESYFRWLYSALTRAKESATFINYTPINSFSKIEIKFSLNKKHKEFYFVGDENYQITNQDYQIKNSFNFPDNKDFLLDFYHLLLAKFTTCNIQISLINHYNYQEQYELIKESQKLTLSIYYNAKAQFKKPTIIASSSDKLNDEILLCLSESTKLNNFNFITDTWRQEAYKKLQKYLDNEDSNISYIIQKPYKDMLLIQTSHNSFNVDINYNGDGFFTKVDILYDEYNELNANNFKKILEKLKV